MERKEKRESRKWDVKRSKMKRDEKEGCFEVYITVNNCSRENNKNSEK